MRNCSSITLSYAHTYVCRNSLPTNPAARSYQSVRRTVLPVTVTIKVSTYDLEQVSSLANTIQKQKQKIGPCTRSEAGNRRNAPQALILLLSYIGPKANQSRPNLISQLDIVRSRFSAWNSEPNVVAHKGDQPFSLIGADLW